MLRAEEQQDATEHLSQRKDPLCLYERRSSRLKPGGKFPGIFRVWYNPSLMQNILSFKDVRNRFRVTVTTSTENKICVHTDDVFFEVQRSGVRILFTN